MDKISWWWTSFGDDEIHRIAELIKDGQISRTK